MKRVLVGIYSVVCLPLSFFGFYLLIQNLGKDLKLTIFYAAMLGIGVMGILLYALFIFFRRRREAKRKKESHREERDG